MENISVIVTLQNSQEISFTCTLKPGKYDENQPLEYECKVPHQIWLFRL